MVNDLNLELGKLLDEYDEKRRAVEARRLQVRTDEDTFKKEFARLRVNVIRPVFEAAGAILKARGHDFSISEGEHAVDPGGKITEADISIQVMPAGMEESPQANVQFPSLSIATRHYNKTVCIRGSNAAPQPAAGASSRGDYQLAQIDAELVQVELMKLIAGIVNR